MPLNSITKKSLHVLNASAGSGKTHRLVKDYIRLIISDNASSGAFRQIMAMTFTNKAAFEMKERIIFHLDKLSSTKNFEANGYDMAIDLMASENLSEEVLKTKSARALESILHQYEDFNIMTIDKFNLKLIRSFGKELNLPDDFEVVLDEREIIEQIVDDLLNKLGSKDNEKLSEIIIAYAKRNLDEDSKWNFKKDLVEFGRVLENEKNNSLIEKLLDTDFSMIHYGVLQGEKTRILKGYIDLSKRLKQVLEQDPHSADELPKKTVAVNALTKITQSDSWPKDSPITTTLQNVLDAELKSHQRVSADLKSALYAISNYYEEHLETYVSLDLFLKNFFNMALLQYMAEELIRIRKEEKLIRISEFNTLISALIKNERAPFIYEKLGTRIHHFLLDEFQDTSRLQWLNLVPLVKESLSQNYDNLIVGDPKQSIYRFKNGVADQFVELPAIYNPENDPFIKEESKYFWEAGKVEVLDKNWRSSPCIVNFNNIFFTDFKEILPKKIVDYYDSLKQKPQSNSNGLVRIISKEEKRSSSELIPMIVDWITECEEEGFKRSEICILGDKNRDCNNWAIELNAKGYDVVSADSLLIHSSLKVQFSIAYLKWRLKPSSESEKKRFAELFFRLNNKSYDVYSKYLSEHESKEGRTYKRFNDALFIEDYFVDYDQFFFKHEQIYDLIQGFFKIAKLNELDDPYLHHLADEAFDYGLHKGPDLEGFIDHYEANKHKMAVQIPESDSAINIMTIHKSKGLEFPVVIIPSMDFSNEVKSSFLTEVNDHIVYKKLGKNELIRQLSYLHQRESEQVIGDNMNKCYVAMTRPRERLYIGNHFSKSSFGSMFHETLIKSEFSKSSEDALIVEIGQRDRTIKDQNNKNDIAYSPEKISDHLWFPSIALQDKEELLESDSLSKKKRFGDDFHLIISRVNEESDIDKITKQAIGSGEISNENEPKILQQLQDLFKDSEYQSLFSDSLNILNEQEFIINEDKSLRPDKIILKKDETIIIDYKTGLPKRRDHNQVLEYIEVLNTMNYPSIKGYLYYVANQSLVRCS